VHYETQSVLGDQVMLRKRTTVLVLFTLIIGLLVAACGSDPTATPAPTPTPTTPVGEPTPTVDPFLAQWAELVAAAQAEGEVQTFICCGLGRALNDVIAAFEAKYNVKVVNSTGGSDQQVTKVQAERSAGQFTIDVWIGGLATVTDILIPEGMVDPIKPLIIDPDVLDASNWYTGNLPFLGPDDGAYIIGLSANATLANLGYNTELLADPDVIQSYQDLLKPEYNGKMVMQDPRFPGMANGLPFYLNNPDLGEAFMRSLITETNMSFLEARPLAEAVAQGKYTLCIFCGRDLGTIKRDGAPVQDNFPHALAEGATIGVGGESMYYVNRAPHPAAAQLFINWLLGAEGMLLAQQASGADSLRVDVPNDGVDEGDIRRNGVDYYWAEVVPGFTDQISPAQALMRDIMDEAGL
jgi:iron(III) transport system substrate-binding protein